MGRLKKNLTKSFVQPRLEPFKNAQLSHQTLRLIIFFVFPRADVSESRGRRRAWRHAAQLRRAGGAAGRRTVAATSNGLGQSGGLHGSSSCVSSFLN